MNSILRLLLDNRDSVFCFFDEVYLFGSALETDTPGDIDLLLVYHDDRDLRDVTAKMQKVLSALCSSCEGSVIDLTTLSKSELNQTKFLEWVPHERI